jgi:N-acetylglucosaminyl-diphospho-decaprenol L-rhamnosyltransferase
MTTKLISVIIPNFNGRKLLQENLPVLCKSIHMSRDECEIIVVDDNSSDGSVDFLREEFPQVKVIPLARTSGFAHACNTAVNEAAGNIAYLLNSDIKVSDRFLEPILTHFAREDTFAVSSVEERVRIPLVKFTYGIFWYWYHEIKNREDLIKDSDVIEVFFVSGGYCAYARDKFLALGGFDTLFRPFYAEDGDICWRAWKRGWRSVLEPKSVVVHQGRGTIGRYYGNAQIQSIHWKNRTLMTWKNLVSKRLWLKHLFFLPLELLLCPCIGKGEFTRGVMGALQQLPELVAQRKRDAIQHVAYSDQEFFFRFSHLPATVPTPILFLHEASRMSGAEQSLLQLVRFLNNRRYKPFIVLPADGQFAQELRARGVVVIVAAFPRVRALIGVFSMIVILQRIMRENGIQVIHSNSIRTHMYAAIAGKLEGVPVVWHQRNLITTEAVDPDRAFSFLPDRIICNSHAIARRFMSKGKLLPKVEVVHNGVDIHTFLPSINAQPVREKLHILPHETVVGIASRFGPDKGHEIFLQAARLIMDGFTPGHFKFLVVGDAVFDADRWRDGYLKNMARSFGLQEQVIFAGYNDSMPQMYAAMDIFVLASHAEPCGRVILEALSMAKPVIVTRSGGSAEMVQDGVTGILIPSGDPVALAGAILRLVSNKQLSKELGDMGRETVAKHFSIQKNVEQIERIYGELTNTRGRN